MAKKTEEDAELIATLQSKVAYSDTSARQVIEDAIELGAVGSIGCFDPLTKKNKKMGITVAGGGFKLMELRMIHEFLNACDVLGITAKIGVHEHCAWVFTHGLNYKNQLGQLKQIVGEHNTLSRTKHKVVAEKCGSAPH